MYPFIYIYLYIHLKTSASCAQLQLVLCTFSSPDSARQNILRYIRLKGSLKIYSWILILQDFIIINVSFSDILSPDIICYSKDGERSYCVNTDIYLSDGLE